MCISCAYYLAYHHTIYRIAYLATYLRVITSRAEPSRAEHDQYSARLVQDLHYSNSARLATSIKIKLGARFVRAELRVLVRALGSFATLVHIVHILDHDLMFCNCLLKFVKPFIDFALEISLTHAASIVWPIIVSSSGCRCKKR